MWKMLKNKTLSSPESKELYEAVSKKYGFEKGWSQENLNKAMENSGGALTSAETAKKNWPSRVKTAGEGIGVGIL